MLFVRCDDRLIHGQVLFKWIDHKKITKIIVVDDEIFLDNIEKQMLLMSKPKNCEIEIINSSQMHLIKDDEVNKMVLFKKIELAAFYVLKNNIEELNLGRMASSIGKQKFFQNIFLDENERQSLRELINNDILVFYQMVPAEEIVNLKHIFEV